MIANPPSPPRGANDQQSSVAVPILLGVLVLAFVVSLVREQVLTTKNQKTTRALSVAVNKLHTTDTIACQFIVADATTRTEQATNSSDALTADQANIVTTKKLLKLFQRRIPHATPAQLASQRLLAGYLQSQITLTTVTAAQTKKNIVLTQALAATATSLATTLPCPIAKEN